MSQKQIILACLFAIFTITGISTVIITNNRQSDFMLAAGGDTAQTVATAGGANAKTLQQAPSQDVSLSQPQAGSGSASSSGLSVTSASPYDASLGQQQTTTTDTKIADTSQSAFSQFDKYKEDSEVLYQELKIGEGAVAAQDSKVAVFYKGWLTNGTLFDQTNVNDKGEQEPFVFTVGAGQVIQGWDLGVQGMKVGGTRRIIIPPSLGYGTTGAGEGAIPPNAVLVFDVTLLAVE